MSARKPFREPPPTREGGAAYMRDVPASERKAVTESMGAGFAPGAPWNSRTEAERAAHPGDLSSVERLDFTKPPLGYEVDTTTFTFTAPSVTAASGRERCIANIDGTSKVSGRDQTLAAAWSHYKGEHDPPGMRVVLGVGLWGFDVFQTRGLWDPSVRDGLWNKAASRAAAWSWYDRRLVLWEKLALAEGVQRTFIADDVWPAILTWSDEQVAEVERWLVDSTAEMPEVLG